MTKYYCKCGKEIGRLVVYWQNSGGVYPSRGTYLYCEECASKHVQIEPFEGFHINIPISITASTKKKVVDQVIHQYLESNYKPYFLPKSDISHALSNVKKHHEK